MNDPMRILKADHRAVDKLLERLKDTEEGTEREQMANEAMILISSHMEAEETLVYPKVGSYLGGADLEEAEIEHAIARDGLERMMSMLEQPGFGAVVAALRAGIKHHVDEEEDQILPELKDALSKDEWQAMGDTLVEMKEAAGLPLPMMTSRRSTQRTRSGSGSRASSNARA